MYGCFTDGGLYGCFNEGTTWSAAAGWWGGLALLYAMSDGVEVEGVCLGPGTDLRGKIVVRCHDAPATERLPTHRVQPCVTDMAH